MTTAEKLRILADSAKYDASCASSGSRRPGTRDGLGHSDGTGICHSYTPDGRCVSLLKILLTNWCVYDCLFCVNRRSSDVPRARFTPEEVVALTLEFYRRNYIEGLFLSSGIFRSADHTMEQLVRVARALRQEHGFRGYIHLKVIPGTSRELVEEAGRWADRLSANIELPTQGELDALAPDKRLDVIERTMGEIGERVTEARAASQESRQAPDWAPAGQSTQMVVGATPATDAVVLAAAGRLYRTHGLRRIYYSAFSPFPGADGRLPVTAPPLVREHRLYQADWLIRFYGFDVAELTTPDAPNLELDRDPKLAWALRHRGRFPIDVNTAPREALLRIPGVGYRSVQRILRIRRVHRLTLADLARLGITLRRARPFIVAADFDAAALAIDRIDVPDRVTTPRQLSLFESATFARTDRS